MYWYVCGKAENVIELFYENFMNFRVALGDDHLYLLHVFARLYFCLYICKDLKGVALRDLEFCSELSLI